MAWPRPSPSSSTRLDGVLFNAGLLGTLSPFEHIQEQEWDEVMQVNVKSEFLLTQALLPLIRQTAKEQGDASIVYTSSSVGRKGRAYWAPMPSPSSPSKG